MIPYLAAAPQDIDALSAMQAATPGPALVRGLPGGLRSGLSCGILGQTATDAPQILLDGRALPPGAVLGGLVAVVILSAPALPAVQDFLRAFAARFGGPAPAVIDLADVPSGERPLLLARALAALLVEERAAQAARNVTLMRDLAQMRQAQARLQEAFSRLEDHVVGQGLTGRRQSLALEPPAGAPMLVLQPGTQIRQRLPQGSAGLSDLAFLIAAPLAQVGGRGWLNIRLETVEDAQTHAEWQLAAGTLEPGWRRLSLPAALEAAARTAILHLDWQGEAPLALALGLCHPDPRFALHEGGAPRADGHLLALRLWSAIPGVAAPAVSGGLMPGTTRLRQLHISGEDLSAAVNLRPDHQPFLYLADSQALLLHVSPAGPSAGLVAAAVPPGATHLSARIMTRAEAGPPIEYAMGLVPVPPQEPHEERGGEPGGEPEGEAGGRAARPALSVRPGARLPRFAPHHVTQWQRLAAMVESELHLPLPAPLAGPHDLCLMARLPEGVEDASWGWSTFAAIRVLLQDVVPEEGVAEEGGA